MGAVGTVELLIVCGSTSHDDTTALSELTGHDVESAVALLNSVSLVFDDKDYKTKPTHTDFSLLFLLYVKFTKRNYTQISPFYHMNNHHHHIIIIIIIWHFYSNRS